MKFRWDKKYLYWGITAFCVIAASVLFYYAVFHMNTLKSGFSKLVSISMPIIDGFVLAYLLNPVLNFIEHKIIQKLYKAFSVDVSQPKIQKRCRRFSITLTMIFFFILLYAFFSLVIPQVLNSIQSIVSQFPVYAQNLEKWIVEILSNNSKIEDMATDIITKYSSALENWMNNSLMPQINVIIREFSLGVIGFAKFLWNFIIGVILSIYIMACKEEFAGQSKKMIYALYSEERANCIIDDVRFINKTFGGFINGKIIDSAIIGVLCFIGMSLLKLPYPLLVSLIVGITNVIPFFGPYLGAIPSALLILIVSPPQAIYFLIFILVLQQFDGNVLGPKILGNSTGLNSFWVIFAITLFGGFFGILGMAVGVPIFAVFYAGLKRFFGRLLAAKGLQTDTKAYIQTKKIKNSKHIPLNNPDEKTRTKQENK